MSLTGSESSIEGLPRGSDASTGRSAALNASQIWLDGDVLSCACPDCAAPMTIRIWLSLAECRLCSTQVELTEEQERAAHALLERRRPPPPLPAPRPVWSQPVRPPSPKPQTAAPRPPAPPPPVRRVEPVATPFLVAEPIIEPPPLPALVAVPADMTPRRAPAPRRTERVLGRTLLETLLSCLISLLLHMLLVVVLGLWFFPIPRSATLLLTAEFVPQQASVLGDDLKKSIDDEKPPEPVVVLREEPTTPEVVDKPDLDPAKLVLKSIEPPVEPPPSSNGGGTAPGSMFANRDPRIRDQVVEREGGSDKTERAVALGLRWLAEHQNADGRWTLDRFDDVPACDGRCRHTGLSSDTSATALALLPFLGAGFTHERGDYRDVVEPALNWLLDNQNSDGSFRDVGGGRMYAHGQATIALCELYALTRDRKLRDPAQRAVDYIVAAQHSGGGWRYEPRQRGDLSVTGWEVMALRSAKSAYLQVPDRTLLGIETFLDQVQSSTKKATFGYMESSRVTPAMTAEGLLCRQYGGWHADHPALLAGADYLLNGHLPHAKDPNMYYWYYATQVMHHVGGDRWKRWNDRMKFVLVESQEQAEHEAGSWRPMDGHDRSGGRLYMTALAVCTLEVYYRHLPLYRSLP